MSKETILPDQDFLMSFRYELHNGGMESLPNCFGQFNRDWLLTRRGDMLNVVGYSISSDSLTHEDWLLHLMAKRWFDANTFLPAYMEALRRAGVREMKQLVAYEPGD